MSQQNEPMPREFLLKQVENEINAGFALVESARKAYKHREATEGDGALERAWNAHQHALRQVSESAAGQIRSITLQLTDLREAIDWLRQSIASSSK